MYPRARRTRIILGSTATAAIAVGLFGAVVSARGGAPRDTTAAPIVDAVVQAEGTPPQLVLQSVTLRRADPRSRVSPHGTPLWRISPTATHDLPDAALRAYRAAATTIDDSRPECGLPWWLLAGIGRVESNHGRYGGSVLGSDGVSRPAIVGVPLNGVGPVAAIPDTDDGRWDNDTVWDRAVGPMQFIPSTWAFAGRDGDGDGVATPNDLDDAALAAAGYLCPASGSITDEEAMRAAIFRYNHSDYYVDLVLAFAKGYQTGVFTIPTPPPTPLTDARDAKGKPGGPEAGQPTGTPSADADETDSPHVTPSGPSGEPTKDGSPTPTPTQPTTPTSPSPTGTPTQSTSPSPSPTPSPTDSPSPSDPPSYVVRTGTWTTCDGGWCLDGLRLDLGGDLQLDRQAGADHDGDGTTESNRLEFDGLAGAQVSVELEEGTAVVYAIGATPYRAKDTGAFV